MSTEKERAAERQDGDYRPPVVEKPKEKKPIPEWKGERKS